ncbi:MAG: NAD(P)/FAD-dependent oxidoreductase [Pseudomonadota bacterium]
MTVIRPAPNAFTGKMYEGVYDLVVVGASFAGLACARSAAMRGLKVAVLDAKIEPGARVRTTGLLVKEAVDGTDVPAALTRKIRGVRLYAPSGAHTDLHAPGYYFLATDTPGLMRWMAREAARAGAHLLFGHRFTNAGRQDGLIRISGLGLAARYLIGADGAKSRVAEAFGLGRNTEFLVGMETEYPVTERVDPDLLHCFIDTALAPGYLGWVVPGAGLTQAGLAVSGGRKPDMAAFMERIDPLFGLSKLDVKARRSGPIPCGGLVEPFGTRNVLLIGDAAGLVSPLTAGGIRLALDLGRKAGCVVSEHLQDGGPDPVRVMAKDYPRFTAKKWLRRAWGLAPPNWLLDRTLFTPPMRALARRIYFHRRGVPGADVLRFAAAPDTSETARAAE